ncbi:transposase, partial [Candidatus Uhrbacteria bacterium]|nr:transposase [Candidatus Uhrbacteria bacterium]
YHVYNRGVDKQRIFFNDGYYRRFLHTIYVLNNFLTIPPHFNFTALTPLESLEERGKPLISVIAGCLMPNHFHLVVSPIEDGGVSKFFHKLGVSYTMYFNKRRERTGRLFESTFKAKRIDSEGYAEYITQYIHMNPHGSQTKSREELENYPWSSLPEYLGKKGIFSLILNTDFRDKVLGMNGIEYRDLFFKLLK